MDKKTYTTDPDLKTYKPGNHEKRKALIVDDESDICYLLGHILKQRDIQTVFAGNLAEAEKMLQTPNGFYYVFLDNNLPDGLGVNHIKRWKQKSPSTHFIMISAHDTYDIKSKAKSDGADCFIAKPFSKEVILNTIVQTSE